MPLPPCRLNYKSLTGHDIRVHAHTIGYKLEVSDRNQALILP
ncbi:MAG TPA: hypothetical protein V6D25_10865 [Leptolyngbyaceae cyanobacterium]